MRTRIFLLAWLLAAGVPAHAAGPVATRGSPATGLTQFIASRSAAVVEIFTLRLARSIDLREFEFDWPPPDEFASNPARSGRTRPVLDPAHDIASGIVIASDGLILTSAHVVAHIDEAQVVLEDGRRFPARILGVDTESDVALLKIEAAGLPVAVLGDSSRLAAGDGVFAIGSPFGFHGSVTAGIVSARDRLVPGARKIPLIQTDVAINPGSSGGPLLNLRGEVVGLNSVIYSGSGGYMGVSFAIPINFAMKAVAQLLRDGKAVHPHLGVEIQDVTPALAQAFRLPRATGALVLRVETESPAQAAGLLAGDIVLAFDGSEVSGVGALLAKIADRAPGARSQLQLWRRGAKLQLPVTLSGQSSSPPVAQNAGAPEWRDGLGLQLSEPPLARLRQLGTLNGLLVQESVGAARSEGIRSGDVIVAVNDERVLRLADFRRLLESATPGSTVALLVLRDARLAYVPVPVGLPPTVQPRPAPEASRP